MGERERKRERAGQKVIDSKIPVLKFGRSASLAKCSDSSFSASAARKLFLS